MTRNEEYRQLLEQLDKTPPALEYTLQRAQTRERHAGANGGCWAFRRGVWRFALQHLSCW